MFAILAAALLFLAYQVVNHYPPWISFYNELLVSLALLLLISHFLWRKNQKFPVPYLAILVMSCMIVPILQFFSGVMVYSGDVWIVCLYVSGLAASYCVGYWSASSYPEALRIFSIIFVCIGIVSTGLALYQWLMLSSMAPWVSDPYLGMRPYANLNQPNHLSTLLLFSWVLGHYLYFRNYIGRLCWWLLSLFLLIGVALAQSRTALVIVVFLLVYITVRMRPNTYLTDRVAIVAKGFLFLLFFHYVPIANQEIMQLPTVSGRDFGLEEPSVRYHFWQTLLLAIYNSPAWGYGWLQTSEAYLSAAIYMPPGRELAGYSHNLFLDLLVWNGWFLGGAMVIAILVCGVRRIWKAVTLEQHFALCAISAVAIHSMVEFPFAYTYFLFPVGFLIGLFDFKYVTRFLVFPRAVVLMVSIVGAGVFCVVVRDYLLSESLFRSARFESARIINRGEPVIYSDAVLLNQLTDFIKFVRTEAKEGMTESEIAWMSRVSRHYPSPGAMFRYSLALALNGYANEARLEIIRLRHVYGIDRYHEAISGVQALTERYPYLAEVTEGMPL